MISKTGGEQAQEAASSSNRPVWPMPETQPEQQEHRGGRELLQEADGDTLEVSTEAVAAKARGIPVTIGRAPAAQAGVSPISQRAYFLCDRSRMRGKPQEVREKTDYDTASLAGEDMLVVLTLRERRVGTMEAAAVTEKGTPSRMLYFSAVSAFLGPTFDCVCAFFGVLCGPRLVFSFLLLIFVISI